MLEAINISYGHPGSAAALFSGFELAVESGERLALAAPSGRGKTTLCRLLSGYLKPQQGQLLLGGQPLPKRGICPVQLIDQHPELAFDPRLRMRSSLLEAGVIDVQLLQSLGIRDQWLQRFPHELSGGELQRFCVARALMTNPRFLIADEITTMLDAITQARIWQLLLDELEHRNMGLVFVSHSPSLTRRIATRVLHLGQTY